MGLLQLLGTFLSLVGWEWSVRHLNSGSCIFCIFFISVFFCLMGPSWYLNSTFSCFPLSFWSWGRHVRLHRRPFLNFSLGYTHLLEIVPFFYRIHCDPQDQPIKFHQNWKSFQNFFFHEEIFCQYKPRWESIWVLDFLPNIHQYYKFL